MIRMDIKNINTAGWRNPQKKTKFSPEKNDQEMSNLVNDTLLPFSEGQTDTSTYTTTMHWLSTWRKVVNNNII